MIHSVRMDKILSSKQLEAVRHIRNFLVHHGRSPSVRELMTLMEYNSPSSAAAILDVLIKQKIIKRRPDNSIQLLNDPERNISNPRTVNIPLLGTVACGSPILAEQNIETMIPVSESFIKPGHRYFLLRAKGDSMNAVNINDGDLVLVKQQQVAENGEIVVALIDDSATIKEFHYSKDAIILKPRSKNKKYQPIILTENFQIQGVVIATIKNFNQ